MPRNDSAASMPIAPGIDMVAMTVIVDPRFGRISVRKTCTGLAPMARAATTNDRFRSTFVWPRTTRATDGQPKTPITAIMKYCLGKLAGTRDTSAIMKISCGKAIVRSVKRDSSVSARPPV
jgi:hypothetical protein